MVPLSCHHTAHLSCLLPWLHRSGTCPVCRQVLRQVEEDRVVNVEEGEEEVVEPLLEKEEVIEEKVEEEAPVVLVEAASDLTFLEEIVV